MLLGFRVAACGLARNDELVVFVIPAKAGIQERQWAEHFVSEQRSEAIFVFARDCFAAHTFRKVCGSSLD